MQNFSKWSSGGLRFVGPDKSRFKSDPADSGSGGLR